jgi:nitrate reductase (cytochrome), electron transfer subunit
MSGRRDPPLLVRALVVAALAATLALAGTGLLPEAAGRDAAPAAAALPWAPVTVTGAAAPIAGEADVFRGGLDDPGVSAEARRRAAAHPRTLATFRALRAFPGAPPRVPHGLTAEELRTGSCNTCHERGGFSGRFAAYAPVTPHPEMTDCLQCHAVDAALAGVPLPTGGGDALCRQCHAPAGEPPPPILARDREDWPAAAWPRAARAAVAGVPGAPRVPPIIPHDLELRGHCVACHVGPAAVAEIRTAHPERADCRQCHVTAAAGTAEFARAAPSAVPWKDDAP